MSDKQPHGVLGPTLRYCKLSAFFLTTSKSEDRAAFIYLILLHGFQHFLRKQPHY